MAKCMREAAQRLVRKATSARGGVTPSYLLMTNWRKWVKLSEGDINNLFIFYKMTSVRTNTKKIIIFTGAAILVFVCLTELNSVNPEWD